MTGHEPDALDRLLDALRRQGQRPHVAGWTSSPCGCGVCRADRFVNRVSGILVGVCVGYFLAHLAIAAIR